MPLVPLYWVGLLVKNRLYDRGWLRVRHLQNPVISVGSLSTGGAGKTPLVLALAELLGRHGAEADVLTRGYGRGSGVAEQVDVAGSSLRFGDEPLEMARAGLPVFVGAERFAAGVLAERANTSRVHLLDDGFQHRRLRRALNVVLLTRVDAEDRLLPAGNLREPLRSLPRADVVVLREEEAEELAGLVPNGLAVWRVRRELIVPVERPMRPVAFCGIARPEGFFSMLEGVGCESAGEIAFADHHQYQDSDFERLAQAARRAGADGFVTTAKDAVKISTEAMQTLEAVGRVWVARLKVIFLEEDAVWARLSKEIPGD